MSVCVKLSSRALCTRDVSTVMGRDVHWVVCGWLLGFALLLRWNIVNVRHSVSALSSEFIAVLCVQQEAQQRTKTCVRVCAFVFNPLFIKNTSSLL